MEVLSPQLQGPAAFQPSQMSYPPKTHQHSRPELFSPHSSTGPPYQEGPIHPHGAYGAIGSSVPSTVSHHVTKSHSLPNPHTPPPYPHMFSRPDMWTHSQQAAIGQNRQPNAMGFPPPRPGNFHPQPFPPSGQPLSFNPGPPLSPQQLREMGPKHKPVGNHRQGRHGSNQEEQFTFQVGGRQRWSISNFSAIPRPAVPLNPVWGQPSSQGVLVSDQSGDSGQFLSSGGSLTMNNPWGTSWSNPSNTPVTPPSSSLPTMSLHFPASSASNVTGSTPAESWLSSSGETEDSEECAGDLGQLLKSLDISDEHVHALKVRTCGDGLHHGTRC